MQWMFLITADLKSRSHARVLQMLDQQMISIYSFVMSTGPEWAAMHILVELEPEKSNRICELLRRMPSVYRVESFEAAEGICRAVTLLHLSCDMQSRFAALQTAASLGLSVVSADSDAVVMEIMGSSQVVGDLETVFSQYGAVTPVARVTLGLVREAPAEDI